MSKKLDKIFGEKYNLKFFIFLIVFLIFYRLFGVEVALFLGSFFLFVLFNWDPRVYLLFGLMFFLFVPVFLMLRLPKSAEQIAFYCYYALSLGLLLQIIQHIKKSKLYLKVKKLNFK